MKGFSRPTTVCRENLPGTALGPFCRFEHGHLFYTAERRISLHLQLQGSMRTRERILANLESIYRESYERARQAADQGRMIDLDSAYMRDQLMLEILLDIRDLFSVAPAASGGSALERLEALRRLTKLP